MERGVRIIFMSLGEDCKQGVSHSGSRAGETGVGPQAASDLGEQLAACAL